ncbi:cytochrome c oxidase subunit 3 [Azospira restricta]|uniref:cytochrome-c oxidase n=1 Tax=Azospira restricta TaxID=404405 RepID=A0A974SPH6_9RHOO|nr:cytochrome c oxidase subunit 3 [Azospira restricta]QRJ64029.1 cytochrome c oxidase subunit 3 [Azospira restricta]
MSQTPTAARAAHYYVPQPSLYPFILSGGLFLLAFGFILQMNKFVPGPWLMLAGVGVILTVLHRWFGKVIYESQSGAYREWEDKSFRYGMIWFIASEVAFFAAFFGALFYVRNISVPDLLGMLPRHDVTLYPEYKDLLWPTAGGGPKAAAFTPMGAWGIPAINTALLLTSGATITWAHWAMLKNNRRQLNLGLFLTIALGVVFLGFQAWEYHHAYHELGLTMGAGVYGATFFMLTGFHGFHVTLGAIMLMVIYGRCLKGHFTAERHFAFEGVAWYWHFVDVVWLGLFVFVYWL